MSIFDRLSFTHLKTALNGDGLKDRALRGVIWTVGGTGVGMILRLGSNLILTRLLFPEVFGLMALVQVFLVGFALFSDIGLHTSIIRSDRSNDPAFLNTVWTLQILRGVILWILACAIALPASWFYEEPLMAAVLPVVGLTALIDGFNPTRIHTANRDLVLGRLTLITISTQIIAIAITILLAWVLQSVWALVIGMLIGAAAKQVFYWTLMSGHRDRFQIERPAFWELLHFGKWLFISSAGTFLVTHADRAILGKFITLELLGIYSIGFFLASVPLLLGQPLASKIIFPLYKQKPPWESSENKRKIFRMRWLLTGTLLTISAVLAVTGDMLVQILYDTRYTLAGPIIVLTVISQLPLVILNSYNQILLAAGDSKRFTGHTISNAIAQTALVIFSVIHFGLIGVILAPGIAALLVYPILVSAVHRYDGWDKKHDIFYGTVALLIAAIGLWVNQSAVTDLVVQTMP